MKKTSKSRGNVSNSNSSSSSKKQVDVRDEDSDEYDDESALNETVAKMGYCHFNEDGSKTTFDISLFGTNLVIVQNPASRSLGHGAVVWDASVILTKYMEYTPRQFNASALAGKTVLELGSGCGLGGVAFMMKGCRVVLSDLPAVVQELTAYNSYKIYRQLLTSGGSFATLIPPLVIPIDWTTFSPSIFSSESLVGTDEDLLLSASSSFPQPPFDIIILTDCVFSVLLVNDLIRTIALCCDSRTEVLCCHEIRDEEANAFFVSELKKQFTVKPIPRNKLHPDYRNDLVELLSAKLKRAKKASSTAAEATVDDAEDDESPDKSI